MPARPAVTVVGSYAVGLTLRVDRFPSAGETRLGSGFDQGPGGKGSNQAIQAARLGADVAFVAALGNDRFGDEALELYRREHIDTSHIVRRAEASTGVGFIMIDGKGENRIIVDPGANAMLQPSDVDAAADRIAASDVVIAQLEIPRATALHALRSASQLGARAILNPAPAQRMRPKELAGIDVITPNETELRVLCGRDGSEDADPVEDCRSLIRAGVGAVVLTRGAEGALIVRADGERAIPSLRIDVVDSTGAGDAFSGTLAVALARGMELVAAVQQAVVAGALTCQQLGVVPALPDAAAMERALLSR